MLVSAHWSTQMKAKPEQLLDDGSTKLSCSHTIIYEEMWERWVEGYTLGELAPFIGLLL